MFIMTESFIVLIFVRFRGVEIFATQWTQTRTRDEKKLNLVTALELLM